MTAAEDPITTVKVPRSLRERIARDAASSGQTAAAFLAEAIGRWERDRRLEAVRNAYATPPDSEYGADIRLWEMTSGDGPPD
jgi:hypothetical protein